MAQAYLKDRRCFISTALRQFAADTGLRHCRLRQKQSTFELREVAEL